MIAADRKPSDILTRAAFINAIRVNSAIGGSTNAIVHLHARNPEDGRPDQSPEAFEPFLREIWETLRTDGWNKIEKSIRVRSGASGRTTKEHSHSPRAQCAGTQEEQPAAGPLHGRRGSGSGPGLPRGR